MRTPAAADRDRITTLRLAAQRIGASEPATPAEVVARMLAMQGQDAPGVRWSVGLRAGGLTETDVVAALAAGELVRSWPLRGTLHLVLAADLRWLLALTGERLLAATAKRRAALDITGDDTRNARAATERALAGRQSLARPAFLAMLAEAGVAVDAQRGYHLIFWLALSGVIVLVGTGDGQPAIGLADEWLPKTPDRDRDDALTDLARRFVTSHGPATDADLARWTGLPLGQVRRGLAGAGTAIERIDIGGTGYWVGAGAAGEAAAGE
ncbi:MAG: winged helix DNA-binding domain-containing protein, partial [Chloroflexota bacterium]